MPDEINEFQDLISDFSDSMAGDDNEGITNDDDSGIVDSSNEEENKDSEVIDNDADSAADPVAELTKKIADLEAKLAESNKPDEEPATEESFQPVVDELQEIDFFGDQDIADIIEDEGTFKTWFSDTIGKVRKADRDAIMQMVYKNLPGIIQKHVNEQVTAKSAAERFYSDYPELKEHKKQVATMANTMGELFPGISQEEFYPKLAELTRNVLGIKAQVEGSPDEKPGKKAKPALVDKSVKAVSKRAASEELDGMEKEIQDLINLMD